MRNLLLLCLLAIPVWAQCNCSNQSGCNALYSTTNTPTLQQYVADVCSGYNQVLGSIANKPQPKPVTLTGQIAPANGSYLPTLAAIQAYGPYQVSYMAQMLAMGITKQDWFAQGTAMAASVQCQSLTTCLAANDCVGGVYLAYGGSLPAGSGVNCTTLWYQDQIVAYSVAHGIELYGGFPQDTAQFTAGCAMLGCSTGGTIASPTMTVAQYEAIIGPFTQAFFLRYGAIMNLTHYQVVVEPLAGMAGIQEFTVAQIGQIIVYMSNLIKTIVPGIKIGAAYTGLSWPTSFAPGSDECYWIDATGVSSPSAINAACTTPQTGAHAALDYLNIDLFGGSCDQSNNAYATELLWFQYHFLATAENPFGMNIKLGQTDRQRFCELTPTQVRPTEQNAMLGCLDNVWNTTGLNQLWQYVIVKWSASVGINDIALYFTIQWFGASTNQAQDNCVLGTAFQTALATGAPNANAKNWEQLINWWSVSMEGPATLSGPVVMSGQCPNWITQPESQWTANTQPQWSCMVN